MAGTAHRLLTRIAKLGVGIGVFATTVAAWSIGSDAIRVRRALPDDVERQGLCSVWFVGSSSIHKWATLQRDMAPWIAHNRGVNGATIDEVIARFHRDAATKPPSAVVFYIGENDIADGVSAADVARRIDDLLDDTRRRLPRIPMFVVAMKPSVTRWPLRAEQERFDAIARADAPRHGATFIANGATLLVDGQPGDFYQPDGVHLSDAGYRRWGGALRVAFERAMPPETVRQCASKR